jgi:hypothetical protein
MLTGVAMAIILAVTPREDKGLGPVQGTVTYHGRPVRGGTICLLPVDPPIGNAMNASIDNTGHYRVDPKWQREQAAATRFRILVFLDHRKYPPPTPPTAEMADGDASGGDRMWGSSEDSDRPHPHVIRAALDTSDLEDQGGTSSGPPEHRFSRPETSNMVVRLDAEPARVDVDLED